MSLDDVRKFRLGRCLRVGVLLLIGALGRPAGAQVPLAIGATDGELSVGQTGEATYSVPIVVVPGTNGIQPELTLSYDSSVGDSLAGVGWMLSGVSVITRCPTTLVQDGFIDGVDFDADDRFCLDGQRLIAVNGAYGADGTEYRTEVDTFTRVFSYGEQGGGPEKFLAYLNTGEIVYYGYSADARIEASGAFPAPAPVASWNANQLDDRNGNYLVVRYFEDTARGESYPLQIDYTGNLEKPLVPYAFVRMEYEPRPDGMEGYQSNALTRWSVRLSGLSILSGETQVRRYNLGYTQAPATGRSQLASIQECGSDGICLPATTFTYPTSPSGFQATANVVVMPGVVPGRPNISTNSVHETFSDLDGDGDIDRAWIPSGIHSIHAMLWTGSGFGPQSVWLAGPPTVKSPSTRRTVCARPGSI
jgi:hypothetical protein